MIRTGPFPRTSQWTGLIAALEQSLRTTVTHTIVGGQIVHRQA